MLAPETGATVGTITLGVRFCHRGVPESAVVPRLLCGGGNTAHRVIDRDSNALTSRKVGRLADVVAHNPGVVVYIQVETCIAKVP